MTRVLGDWAANILHFWFDEIPREAWFGKEEAFDQRLRERFLAHHEHIAVLPVADCVRAAETAMASVIALDQFPRNMFRSTPRAFATDAKAREIADRAIVNGFEAALSKDQRSWALAHKDVIDRFGRFPHRNNVLGRMSTPEEIAFLAQPGSSF